MNNWIIALLSVIALGTLFSASMILLVSVAAWSRKDETKDAAFRILKKILKVGERIG